MGGVGQHNLNPISTFQEHLVVQIGQDIYDPSYGRIFKADEGKDVLTALKKFQGTVFGFFTELDLIRGVIEGKRVRVPPGSIVMAIEPMDSSKLQFKLKP